MHPQEHNTSRVASMQPATDDETLLNSAQTRRMVGGVSEMCIWRWSRDEGVRFPRPDVVMNRRKYWFRATIRRWQAERAAATQKPAAA